jgi:hypothetical protein
MRLGRHLSWLLRAFSRGALMSIAMKQLMYFIGLGVLALPAFAKEPKQVPVNPPVCSFHIVQKVHKGERMEPGSDDTCAACASGLEFKDGTGSQTPYKVDELLEASRPGDKIRSCVISKYINCPKGDEWRGTTSIDRNMRTGHSWQNSSSHICGGA